MYEGYACWMKCHHELESPLLLLESVIQQENSVSTYSPSGFFCQWPVVVLLITDQGTHALPMGAPVTGDYCTIYSTERRASAMSGLCGRLVSGTIKWALGLSKQQLETSPLTLPPPWMDLLPLDKNYTPVMFASLPWLQGSSKLSSRGLAHTIFFCFW